MKNFYATGLLVVCLLSVHIALAQPPVKQQIPDKPLQFSTLPDKFEFDPAVLTIVSSSRTNDQVNIQFGKFTFTGRVAERVQKTSTVESINIRSTNYPGALFNLSVHRQPGHAPRVTGRIINPQSGDVLVLVEENNRYYLQKVAQKFFMTE